jgi:hypothetical protein
MLRELSYLLVHSKKLEDYGVVPRLVASTALLMLLLLSRFSGSSTTEALRMLVILAAALSLSSIAKGFKAVASGLKLVLVFTIVGFAIFYLNSLFGLARPSLEYVVLGSLRIVAFFACFSLFFQLLSPREWRVVLSKLGARRLSVLYSIALIQVPVVLFYLSEAVTTIKLKYGGKRLYRAAVPLVLFSVHTSRSLYEAHLVYGYGEGPARLALLGKMDWRLVLLLAAVLACYALAELVA